MSRRRVHLRYQPVVTLGTTRTACGRTIAGPVHDAGASVQSYGNLDATVDAGFVTCGRCLLHVPTDGDTPAPIVSERGGWRLSIEDKGDTEMEPTAKAAFATLAEKVEAYRAKVAAVRDEGRKLFAELEAIMESVDRAADSLDEAAAHAKAAVEAIDESNDTLSRYA